MKTAIEIFCNAMDEKLRAEAEKAFPGLDAAFMNQRIDFISSHFPEDRLRSIRFEDVAFIVKKRWIEAYIERTREKFYQKIIAGALAGNDANEPF